MTLKEWHTGSLDQFAKQKSSPAEKTAQESGRETRGQDSTMCCHVQETAQEKQQKHKHEVERPSIDREMGAH